MGLLGVLLVAVMVHEGTHWLLLRHSGAKIRPAILRPKPVLLMSLGLGWAYDPAAVGSKWRSRSYLYAPLAELVVWITGTGVVALQPSISSLAPWCLALGLASLAGNWFLPRGDGAGWRRVRRELAAQGSSRPVLELVGRLEPRATGTVTTDRPTSRGRASPRQSPDRP